MNVYFFFFFSSRRRHTRCYRDWSSDVCSSDLERKIVRVIPVESCIGIGIATPKGIDTSSFRGMVQNRLAERSVRPVPPRAPGAVIPNAGGNGHAPHGAG